MRSRKRAATRKPQTTRKRVARVRGKKGAAPRSRKRSSPRRRRNPELLTFLGNPGGKVFGTHVDAIYYRHVTEGPRVHKFSSRTVKMAGMKDGSIRIFDPKHRLWEDM